MVRTVFASMVVVVVFATITTYWFGLRVLQAHGEEALHHEVISRLERLVSTIKDAETGQRGFLLTGNEEYLQPYENALLLLPREQKALGEMREADLDPQTLESMGALVATKLVELKQTIDLQRNEGSAAAQAVVREGAGRQTMDSVRESISKLITHQKELLLESERLVARATAVRTGVFIASGLTMLGFVGWAFRQVDTAVRAQQAALAEVRIQHEELQRQKELLHVTLSSIGDCVIVTDLSGRITFLNQVAEQVLGWPREEALNRPTGEVFRIINEQTRAPVENPVEKVLKHGVIVGLANHTVLIRKDGSEIPIDDSGAPIRDENGTLRGAVLVFRDFSEYKAAERELKAAKETAEAANKAKDQFLAMLSHELRTPLTPVLATLELWGASDELADELRGDVRMMQRNVEMEARIIDDLLDLTRVARGVLNTTLEDTDVHEILEFLIGMCRSEFHVKQLRVVTQLEADRFLIHTDAGRFQQVIWNVLRNASKFTGEGGEIIIRTENDRADNIRIKITDNGIGMTRETLERLFVPFEQGQDAVGRKYGGLGLGMAISHALVELLGGKLVAESRGPNLGSTFTVTFPAFKSLATVRTAPGASSRPPAILSILIVEDHDDTAAALSRLLERRGHETAVSKSVATANELLKARSFDLVLCDLGLPDGTGIDVIRELRQRKSTPALALSGFGMEEDVRRCLEAGFDGHVTKPVNFQKLEVLMWQVLGNRA